MIPEPEALEGGDDDERLALELLDFAELGREPALLPGPGERVGDFVLEEEIGRGGMGVVYRARQPDPGRSVAVKLIPLGSADLSEAGRARIEREGRLLASLSHEAIVSVHAAGTMPGFRWVAMDWIDGAPLSRWIAGAVPGQPAPGSAGWLSFLLPRLAAVADALAAAHAQGILHRDVKPDNVLLDGGGRPFLVDFGLAREERSTGLTQTAGFVGTPRYASPEQVRGERLTPATDVFSFGALAFEALTARPAFPGGTPLAVQAALLHRDPGWPRGLRVPPDLRAIVERCLEKRAGDRYPDGRELAGDLARLLRFEPVHAVARGPAARAWRSLWRRPGRALVAAALLALALSALFFAWIAASRSSSLAHIELLARYEEGLERYELGDLAGARRLLEQASAGDGAPPAASGLLGELALWEERGEEAAERFARALAQGSAEAADRLGLVLARGLAEPPADEGPEPRTPRDHAMLARLHRAAGDEAAARAALDRALAERPTVFTWRVERGRLLEESGLLEPAAADFRVARDLRPADPAVLDRLARLLVNLDRNGEAEQVLRQAQAIGVESPAVLAGLALALQRQKRPGDEAEALDLVHRALELDPDHDYSGWVLARVYGWAGRPDEARSLLEHWLVREPDAAPVELGIAWLDYQRGDYGACVERVDALLDSVPRGWLVACLDLKGQSLLLAGRYAEAIPCFEELERLRPGRWQTSYNLGRCLVQLGRLDEARAAGERSLEANPQSGRSLHLVAGVHHRQGRYWDALLLYERAMALEPEASEPPNWISQMWWELGQLEAALPYAELAASRRPDWGWYWVQLAALQWELGRYADARPSYERALAILDEPRVRVDYADTLAKVGEHELALQEFEAALAAQPGMPAGLAGLGEFLMLCPVEALRDLPRAAELLQAACDAEPENEHYRELWRQAREGMR